MFIPYSVDVPMQRWPFMNWAVIVVTVVMSVVTLMSPDEFEQWMLIGPGEYFSFAGLFGSLVTHLDPVHLIGNMVFLFVFGNAVNAKIGHLPFVLCYAGVGVVEGLAWALLADGPALGASGAIMGMVGMFVVFYPRNDVSVAYWFYFRGGSFELPGLAVVGAYFAFDLWGMLAGGGEVAYLAHIAGFVAGFAVASAFVLAGLFPSDSDEENLYEVLGVR